MGGLLIKTIRGAAEINGTSAELNAGVMLFGGVIVFGLLAFYAWWAIVRLTKWAWTHAL